MSEAIVQPGSAQPSVDRTSLGPDNAAPSLESYAFGLLNEEAGEIAQEIGKAMRFGMDTRSPVESRYAGTTPRERLQDEIADMLAAIQFAEFCGLLNMMQVTARASKKLALHKDPDFRKLAVMPEAMGASGDQDAAARLTRDENQ